MLTAQVRKSALGADGGSGAAGDADVKVEPASPTSDDGKDEDYSPHGSRARKRLLRVSAPFEGIVTGRCGWGGSNGLF